MSENALERLERYVKSAVRGLYGRRRAQVTRELRGNLEHRVGEFMAFGNSREQATERALLEFGAAGEVARGLREVHIMPLAIKSGVGMTLILGLSVSLWASSSTAVSILPEIPPQVCTAFKDTFECNNNREIASTWIDLESLTKELTRQGVLAVPSTVVDRDAMMYQFPSNEMLYIPLKNYSGKNAVVNNFTYNGKIYIGTSVLFGALNTAKFPYELNPGDGGKLTIGKISISLRNFSLIEDAISQTLSEYLRRRPSIEQQFGEAGLKCCSFYPKARQESETTKSSSIVSFQGTPKQGYLIIRAADLFSGGRGAAIVVRQADASGRVEYSGRQEKPVFYKTLKQLSASKVRSGAMVVRLEWNTTDYFDLANVFIPSSVSPR